MQNFHVVYDSERGALVMFYSPRVRNIVFQFSPAINPVKVTQIKKGMKIYDYENSHFFSLSLPESSTIVKMLSMKIEKDINIGPIQFKIDQNSGNKIIRVAHFPQKKDERSKDNIIVSELGITTGSNPISGSTVTYKKIQNKKPVVNVSIRMSYPDFLAMKCFLEKHPDFIAISHTLFMNSRVNKQKLDQNKKSEDYEENYIDDSRMTSEFEGNNEVDSFDENFSEETGGDTEQFF